VEAAICESLGKLGATESVDALITRLETGTDAVKDAAVRALRNITRQPFDADPVKWKEWRSGAHQ
jgi:HEAT repeat protein